MSNTTLAAVGLNEYKVSLTPEAIALRDSLLEKATFVTQVTNKEEHADQVSVTVELRKFLKGIETARTELKAPVLEAGRTIDQTAKAAVVAVEHDLARLEGLGTKFLLDEERKAREHREEQERIQREHQKRIGDERRAEEAKVAALKLEQEELERKALESKSKAAREQAAAAAKKLEEQIMEREIENSEKAPEPAPEFVPTPKAFKPKGVTVRRRIVFQILDKDALFRAYPHLFDVTPRVADINYLINSPGVNLTSIPGIKTWEDVKANTRTV